MGKSKIKVIGIVGEPLDSTLRHFLSISKNQHDILLVEDIEKHIAITIKDEVVPFPKPDPNPIQSYIYGKQFVCKGKHQYREVKIEKQEGLIHSEWICQCGKKLYK